MENIGKEEEKNSHFLPHRSAAEDFQGDKHYEKALRNAGFTSTVTFITTVKLI
jgi:hypothetical protein